MMQHSRTDATHMGTMRYTRQQVLMKRGKRGQWLVWTEARKTGKGGRWEGFNYQVDDFFPVKFKKEVAL